MLRSRSNALVSVRRVSEVKAGRRTAGIDGEVVLTGQARVDLADWVQHRAKPWTARPVRRVTAIGGPPSTWTCYPQVPDVARGAPTWPSGLALHRR